MFGCYSSYSKIIRIDAMALVTLLKVNANTAHGDGDQRYQKDQICPVEAQIVAQIARDESCAVDTAAEAIASVNFDPISDGVLVRFLIISIY